MVAGNDDEGFLRVFLVKLHRFGNRLVEGQGVMDRGGGIVGMAGPIDLAAFDHHQEAIGVIEDGNALGHIFGHGHMILAALIHGVIHRLVLIHYRVHGNDLA